jgi:galactokinase
LIQQIDCQGDLTDRSSLRDALNRAGFGPAAAAAKGELFGLALQALPDHGGVRPQGRCAFYVPGRIEFLGKHTDYAGGASIVAAVERGIGVVGVPRDDRRVRLTDAVRHDATEFDLLADAEPRNGHWENYPVSVARRLVRNFDGLRRGADIAFASDLPPAAGMSSSSAMVTAAFCVLAEVNSLWDHPRLVSNVGDPTDLAGYLATIENGQSFRSLTGDQGVGTFGGSEDHTAILCSRPGHLAEYTYCPVRFCRWLPVPKNHVFVVAVSGVAAEKTGAAMERYNRASSLARQLVALWRQETGCDAPHLAAILAESADAGQRMATVLREAAERDPQLELAALRDRFEHFRLEHATLLPAAGEAILQGDLAELGRVVQQSQQAAERLLGNQTAETSGLTASARTCGAVAASAFGAGFGGSVWALVARDEAESFCAAWSRVYGSQFSQHTGRSRFFLSNAGPAAFQLKRAASTNAPAAGR